MTIKLNNLTVSYGQVDVLKNVTLEILSGIISVEGRNGSGKSTLLKVLGGSLIPKKGEVQVYDQNINYTEFAKRHVSVCPEVTELPDLLTAKEYLSIVSKLRLVNVSNFIFQISRIIDFDLASNKLISDYSHGMRQKLCVLATFIGSRRVLLFDESFASMDQESRKHLLQKLVWVIDETQTEVIVMVNHNPDYKYVASNLRRLLCKDMQLIDVED